MCILRVCVYVLRLCMLLVVCAWVCVLTLYACACAFVCTACVSMCVLALRCMSYAYWCVSMYVRARICVVVYLCACERCGVCHMWWYMFLCIYVCERCDEYNGVLVLYLYVCERNVCHVYVCVRMEKGGVYLKKVCCTHTFSNFCWYFSLLFLVLAVFCISQHLTYF